MAVFWDRAPASVRAFRSAVWPPGAGRSRSDCRSQRRVSDLQSQIAKRRGGRRPAFRRPKRQIGGNIRRSSDSVGFSRSPSGRHFSSRRLKDAPSLPDGRLLRSTSLREGLGFARVASADLPPGDTSLREVVKDAPSLPDGRLLRSGVAGFPLRSGNSRTGSQ